jgi:3-oxoacyl-[acyl-carrier-protein] synthase II
VTDVLITGAGVVSPFGHTVDALTAGVLAGDRAAVGGDGGRYVDDIPLAMVPAENRARIGRLDRVCRLFLSAALLAVDDAKVTLTPAARARIGLSFGTGLGCVLSDAEFYEKLVAQGVAAASPRVFAYTVSSAAAGEVSIALGIHGPNATLHMGWAAGAAALGYALDCIRLGTADLMLAGGADAIGSPITAALRDMGLLASGERDVPGIAPSEGAAVLVLEREDRARARGARARGRVRGYGAACEPTLTTRTPQSAGIAAALRAALRDAGTEPERIDLAITSAHGTAVDACEADALDAVLGGPARRTIAPKATLGECFGASGALGTAIALGLFERGLASTALLSSVCYSGPVAALVLDRA